MKLEQNEQLPIFSTTTLPDIFFTEYLPEANGDYIKIYLYILFLSKYDKDIKVNDLCKKLGLLPKVIQDGMKYWEDKGVLMRKNTGYIINDLQEKELGQLYKPKVALSAEQIQKSAENQQRAKTIEYISTKFFSGLMPTSWYPDIELWFKKYNFDDAVMVALFQWCYDRSALHRNYIQAVADGWHKNNIKVYDDLEKYFEKQENLKKIGSMISKKLGISRALSQYEYAYIEKWVVDFNYPFDVIEIALKRTTSKINPSFDYIDKLICDWNERGLKTASQVNQFLEDIKQRNKITKQSDKKTSYQKYDQRSYDNLNDLYANKRNNSKDDFNKKDN